jgi:rhodanese-related sulfurtransferase
MAASYDRFVAIDSEFPNAAVVSARWIEWRRRTDIEAYDERFERMAAAGQDVHGEADFVASFSPVSILDAGCGTGRIAIELTRRGFDVVGVDLDADMVDQAKRKAPRDAWFVDDLGRMQLDRRFDLIAMPGNVMLFCEPDDRRLIVHNLAQHLLPGGRLVAGFSLEADGYSLGEWDAHCRGSGLELEARYGTWSREPFVDGGDYHVSVHRRVGRFTVHDLIAEAREDVVRLSPAEVASALTDDPTMVVVDTRQQTDRDCTGHVPGSVHLPRTVLEWRVDPASGYSDDRVASLDRRIVLYCNDGYSSSLAAANLRRLGFARATDMIGGFNGWLRAGLPVSGTGEVTS